MKIDIMGLTYDIERAPAIDSYGIVCHSRQKIRICEEQGEERVRFIAWHEIIHVILDNLGLTEVSKNEKMVDVLALGILNVIKNNPEFTAMCLGERSAIDETT